ncbi:AfsR/SARP family transcriptional regulator [Planomonospora sp. ID91781]|uniref:AfsR/SARP family transcriptional regulator n=1 Tax=Planomonospora sp. ID91781 TaxID=2738135 RepID=UPI0018C3D3AD|nr:BTAD domain-containing putative transcriptional regulator [Planomonospora sp. ID91781]MBG0824682.1 AfsR/SARP family transcriptional regulator [Planomonospora sp. ID91781]
MRFGVLGPLAVWTASGERVAVPGLKVRTLLADLLVHEGRPVPADRLIDDLWGDDRLPGNPSGALSAKVSQLRRILEDAEPGGRELVAHHPAGYLLRADTDADGFRALLAEAGRTGDPRARSGLLSEALAAWRGPAFADFADEPFARAAAARLTEQWLAAQEDRAEVRLALGEHALLAGELGELLTAHPLRERLRAAHMRALYRSGRQSEALGSYEELRALLADELGLDPGAELAGLHRAILVQDPALAAPRTTGAASGTAPGTAPDVIPGTASGATADPAGGPSGSLPVPVTALIGRDDALAGILARLETDRLVTLTGPGGVGKTRLAVEAARILALPSSPGVGPSPGPGGLHAPRPGSAGRFPDGAWLVELAALDRPADRDAVSRLAEAVMTVLDVRDTGAPAEPGERPAADRLAGALRHRRLLLVLDNCEHVVEPVAELAGLLLRTAPGLRILATSQEPLALAGEVVWSVPPLEVPDGTADLAALERTASVQLFTARASAAARGFTLDAESAPAVATLCRRLDGIPLALELAATRVRALGVRGLVERLDDRFRLLSTGHRGAPPRQQTLTAMIDWSWELLPGPERTVLRRLAVHADGCTPQAAEAVCAGDGVHPADVLDLLVRLVDRSLVVMVDGPDGPRYRLLESVAAYCLDRLQEAGELDRVRRRHLLHHIGFAERAEAHLRGPGQRRWLRRLDAEAANLRAALNTAVREADAEGALRLAVALAWYWFLRGRLTEARRSLSAALTTGADGPAAPAGACDGSVPTLAPPAARSVTALRAAALAWAAGFGFLQGDVADRESLRDAALRLYEEAGDPAGHARARWFLAHTAIDLGDLAVAEDLLDRALRGFRAVGDRWGTAAALATRAKLAHVRGDLTALGGDGGRSAELFTELGDRWGLMEATGWLGALAELTGDLERAERLQRDGLRMAEELGLWTEAAGRLAWVGWTALQRRGYAEAAESCGRALKLAVEQGHRTEQIFAAMGFAFAVRRQGHLELAEIHLRDVLERAPRQDTGTAPPPYLPMVLTELGFAAEQRGDAAAALSLHLEALDQAARLDASRVMPIGLDGLAGAAVLAGDHDRAALLLGAAAAARAAGSPPASPAEHDDIDRITGRVRAALGEDRFAAGFERGGTLTPQEALSLAAAPAPAASGPPAHGAS